MSGPESDPRAGDSGDGDRARSLDGALADALPTLTGDPDDVPRRELIRARLFGDPDDVEQAVRIGRFVVLERVGAGAMGVVYAAYDRELDRKVAIKLLRAERSSRESETRLQREAQALAQLSDRNVIAIHEVGRWEGRVYLAMEFVPGDNLDQWQRRAPRTWREILDVYIQAARGLAATHEAGLVHRDFKPTNVLVGDDGRVRVADFGMVSTDASAPREAGVRDADTGRPPSPADRAGPDERLTATRGGVGTPAYMAPEQSAGARADARADQYSFCVALHEAMYGVRGPDAGAPPSTSPDRLTARARAPSEIRTPRRLRRAVRRGLATDPRDRYPSMAALLADLERVANAPRRRRRLALFVVAAATVATVIAASFRWNAHRVQRAHAETQCVKAVSSAERIVGRDPTTASALLRDAPCPDDHARWMAAANAVLQLPTAVSALRGPPSKVARVAFSPDGRYLAASFAADVTPLWRLRGDGAPPPVLDRAISGRFRAFRADGAWLITLSGTNTVHVWERSRPGVPLATFHNSARVAKAEFLPDRDGIFWLLADGTLRVWQPGHDAPRELALGRALGMTADAKLTADGDHIARWERGGPLEVWRLTWDPLSAERRWRSPAGECGVHSARFDPGGRHLYAGCANGDLQRWDLDAPTEPQVWRGPSASIRDLEIMADGRVLTIAADDTARLWNPAAPSRPEIVAHHEGSIVGSAFSPDGRRVLTISVGSVQLRDLGPSRELLVLRGAGAHSHGVPAFSPDGGQVAVGYSNGEVRVWNVGHRDSFALHAHEAGIWSARLAPDGARLVTASFDGTVGVWDLERRERIYEFRGHRASDGGQGRHVYAAELDPRGERIASGAGDGTARIWRVGDGGHEIVLPGHEEWAYRVAWSPDGRRLATGSKHGVVRVWGSDGEAPIVLAPPRSESNYRIHALAFSPDGERLMAVSLAGYVWLWHLAPTRARFEHQVPYGAGYWGAFSPDGRSLAVSAGPAVFVFDGSRLEVLAKLEGHEDDVYHLAFSPDGHRLVTASADGTTRVWRRDGRLEHILYGHADRVVTAAFDPAGERVITGSSDGVVRVWRLDAPAVPVVLRGHTGEVRFAAFTPGGDRAVTAAMDGTVRVWTVLAHPDGASLRRQLRAATTACLTVTQRIQHLGESETTARGRSRECASRTRPSNGWTDW